MNAQNRERIVTSLRRKVANRRDSAIASCISMTQAMYSAKTVDQKVAVIRSYLPKIGQCGAVLEQLEWQFDHLGTEMRRKEKRRYRVYIRGEVEYNAGRDALSNFVANVERKLMDLVRSGANATRHEQNGMIMNIYRSMVRVATFATQLDLMWSPNGEWIGFNSKEEFYASVKSRRRGADHHRPAGGRAASADRNSGGTTGAERPPAIGRGVSARHAGPPRGSAPENQRRKK